MSWTAETVASDLRALGLKSGDSVLTHSSLKSLGTDGEGPAGLIRAILEVIDPDGTALFPTHTWKNASPETPPTFDVRQTPSAQVGIVAEFARVWPGAVRSVHPTHSVVAIGSEAKWFTEGHYADGICGLGSPYDHLCTPKHGTGYILLIGVDQERNTSLHMAEEMAGIPFAIAGAANCTITDERGVVTQRYSHFHTSRERKFMIIDTELDTLSIQKHGKVGCAECRLIHASELRNLALQHLAEDPNFFWANLRAH